MAEGVLRREPRRRRPTEHTAGEPQEGRHDDDRAERQAGERQDAAEERHHDSDRIEEAERDAAGKQGGTRDGQHECRDAASLRSPHVFVRARRRPRDRLERRDGEHAPRPAPRARPSREAHDHRREEENRLKHLIPGGDAERGIRPPQQQRRGDDADDEADDGADRADRGALPGDLVALRPRRRADEPQERDLTRAAGDDRRERVRRDDRRDVDGDPDEQDAQDADDDRGGPSGERRFAARPRGDVAGGAQEQHSECARDAGDEDRRTHPPLAQTRERAGGGAWHPAGICGAWCGTGALGADGRRGAHAATSAASMNAEICSALWRGLSAMM